MKFFGSDWCGDQGLRSCSLAARGLWLEMLLVMDRSEPRGSLLLNGKQIDTRRLASIVGADKRDVETFFRELDDAGVFSRDGDGTVFSRKMRRDEARAERDKANGRGGGNPTLKPKDKAPDKPKPTQGLSEGVNPQDKAQKLEARGQKDNLEAQRTSAAPTREDFDKIEGECRKALGELAPSDPVIGPIVSLIEQGLTISAIVGILLSEAKRSRPKPIRTWFIWAKIISERIADQPKLGVVASGAVPNEPAVDLGNGAQIPESRVIKTIENYAQSPYAHWIETQFGDAKTFRRRVSERAPHLMKFWPDEPARAAQ